LKKLPLGFILGFVLLIFLADVLHLFDHQELGFVDLRFRLRGAQAAHPDIVIVEIDDASISQIGHWPWPRSYHAALLKILGSYHPRLILYDVLFTEESTHPEEDQLLSSAAREAGNVIGAFFFRSENPFVAFFPISAYRQAVRYLGFANIFIDPDGKIRRITKSIHPPEGDYYHSSVVAALSRFSEADGRKWVEQIPVDRKNSFWINFPGEYSIFQRIPFHTILQEEGENGQFRKLFENKFVIVGQTATGGGDFRPTSFSSAYPGVGIQAASLHTLLNENYLRELGAFPSLLILVFLGFLVTFLTAGNSPRRALFSVLGVVTFYLAWNFLMFSFLGWILPVFSPLVVMIGVYIFVLFFQFMESRLKGELLNRELTLAARIQESFLPHEMPQMKGLELGFLCRFAKEVGGDLYDWVPLGNRRLGICVGDVSGKGVPASLYMARAISEWRSLAKDFQSPSGLLQALNQRLVQAGVDGMFLTFLYLIFDLDSKSVLFSNAGHEPFYLFRSGKQEWVRRASAQPLGLFLQTRYTEEKMNLEEGDTIIMISDGVRELRNPKGEEFGLAGAEKAFNSFPQETAPETVRRLFQAMDSYSHGRLAHDDRTVLAIKIEKLS